ncbi:MAG: transposase [Omnitrophica bacterium]|nr:transposase [Candidatus Omnitrophota bacterium]
MPRGKRLNITGGVYHVITRGLERKEIFKDDVDRREFLTRLEDSLKKTKSKCYAWVLMPNHVHLMIRTGTSSLSDVMHRVLTGYAIYFNRRHKRRGYLYQNRYKSILCQEDAYFEELVRYIHLNPLRAKIAKGVKELDKYKWCGHYRIIGSNDYSWQDKEEVLLCFGKRRKEAVSCYRQFIEDGIDKREKIDFSGGGLIRSAGGWSELLNMKRKKEYWRGDERILGDDGFVNRILKEVDENIDKRDSLIKQGWNLDKIAKRIYSLLKIKKMDLNKKGRDNIISKAKGLICYFGNKELGVSGKEIGSFLGISQPAISKLINKGAGIVQKERFKLLN